MGSGITLTNNEIKDIIKVSRSLENRGWFFRKGQLKTRLFKKEDDAIIFLVH